MWRPEPQVRNCSSDTSYWEEISGGEGSVYLEDIWDTPGSEGAPHHSVYIPARDITFVERAHHQTVQDLFKYLQGLYSSARNFTLKFPHSIGIILTFYLESEKYISPILILEMLLKKNNQRNILFKKCFWGGKFFLNIKP